MTIDELENWQHEIPRDRQIILYCSSPNETGVVQIALLLHRKGFARVRPLLGGFEAWGERNYPTELRTVVGIPRSTQRNLPAELTAGAAGQTGP